MRDSELVAAIVAGDPEGLAAAYDKYAAQLYNYCRSVLREPADAADAVQDTFVIAASRLDGLRDRDRLRPWLYAVARNECRRRIRARTTTSALEEAPDVTDETADVGGDAERAELRALLRSALRGLNPAEQEVIELQLRQGLEGTEVADVLGISRNHAHALISRARDQLEVCLGVLLVARTGRNTCAALNTLLEGWDGQLTALMRKRLNRHVERCTVCSERKRTALRPAMLLGLAPVAAIPVGAAAPPGLRDQVLRLASSNGPDAVAHRATLAARTTHFSQQGFPKPLDPPKHWWQTHSTQVTAAAAAAAAVIVVASLVIANAGPHSTQAASGGAGPGAVSSGRSPAPGQSAPGQSPAPGVSGPPSNGAGIGGTGPGGGGQPTPGSLLTGSPSAGTGTSPGAPSPGSSSPGTPAPSSSKPATTPPPPSVTAGTLTVSPTSVLLSTLGGTSITIAAQGGPVSWSISEPGSLIGLLKATPSSGTLQAGQRTTVDISVSGLLSVDTVLTVNPGGHSVSVLLGVL